MKTSAAEKLCAEKAGLWDGTEFESSFGYNGHMDGNGTDIHFWIVQNECQRGRLDTMDADWSGRSHRSCDCDMGDLEFKAAGQTRAI